MNIYIWNHLNHVTNSYHDEGALSVVARNLDHAKELVKARLAHLEDLPDLDTRPDAVYTLADTEEPAVFIFPNSGCC